MSDTLENIIEEIKRHDKEHPDHGVGCACHDKHAATLRRLFRDSGLIVDKEGYFASTKSMTNLMTVIGYVQRNH